jgi:tRNA(Ile)-lysidine synthase TilS/MesJ
MDPGYNKANRELIESNAKLMDIPVTIFETNIFESVVSVPKYPCYLCARMRRGNLYAKAKQLGCNKIALGHHFDDVIETTLLSLLYGGQIETMLPKLKSENFDGMELIRPMYLIREKEIIHWRDYNNLKFLQCACKFTELCEAEERLSQQSSSKRKKVKKLIETLAKDDPQIEASIFKSTENVNLAKILSYKDETGVRHEFLDRYKDITKNHEEK